MKIHMVLAVEDQSYVEAFLEYVRGSEYGRQVQITAFSRPDAFRRFWLETQAEVKPDFAAAEPAFVEGWPEKEAAGLDLPWVCLSNTGMEEVQAPVLSKFRPLPELLENLLEHGCRRHPGSLQLQSAEIPKVPVVGIYSAAGGTGKTTVGLHLMKQLASGGKRGFYLNLKTFALPSSSAFRQAGSRGLAELLYELEAAAEHGQMPDVPISGYIVRHPLVQGDMFGQAANLRELIEMDKAETVRLIDYVASSGSYDFVVVVCDAHPDGRAEGLMERCDYLIWLLLDDEEVLWRTAASMEYYEKSNPEAYSRLLAKTQFVFNRFSGTSLFPSPRPELIPSITLPEIPDWRHSSKARVLADAPAFQRDLLRLCRLLRNGEHGGNYGSAPWHD
ncbi:hypothetical protein [Paenibacillus pinistramenti]|uniref:hypothetical protein n=1 Tax=Paenibacillus pinistramenti TaxID=1768003 RepID=UPI001109421F|nr:hypothetical protein [Paenibacillus pinistramenti]